jgi:diguanylate cyclase (GGDEF)-like protein/PAS domain S-box-containing protein
VAGTTENSQLVNTDPELIALRQLCIDTLLASPEERVYFTDHEGRNILVSAGSLAVLTHGGRPEDAVGKTVFELLPEEVAKAAHLEEKQILETGETIVGKVRPVNIPGHDEMWIQTTKMALRDATGAIVGTFGISRDLTAQIEAENALAHQALHDGLTGLPNRALILDRIEQMLARARRSRTRCTAMFLDLDNFKDINDTLGHHAGDELLVAVADRLSNALRPSDTVGRLGGDEFVVLVEGESMNAGPELIADRILDVLRTPFEIAASPAPILVSASIGIAECTGQSADQLLREADIALYQAKDAGKRCAIVFAPTMQASAQIHRKLAADLESALAEDQFFLLYQPTVDLQTGDFTGVEALLRWEHPEEGTIQPDDFIPELEASGLIVPVGSWVLESACRQGAAWLAAGHRFSLSVNVSAKQIIQDRILSDVEHALSVSGFDPTLLVLELTETSLMHDVQETVARLGLLRGIGVRIAVDDFGTGYSSLAYLRQFPIDILKIDRSFVSGIADSNEAAALLHTLAELGRALNLETIAEGVEHDQQRLRLQNENVHTGQGFLFSRPIEATAIDRLLGSRENGESS